MKILIIAAMQEELDSIISSLGGKFTQIAHLNFNYYTGKYHNHELSFILSGIGKVNATIHTQFMIDKISPDLVVNIGVAGALNKALTFGDVVIANDLVQHDIDVRAFGIELGQIPRMDVFSFPSASDLLDNIKYPEEINYKIHTGRIVSGDQFIDDESKAIWLNKQFNAIACEMEGAAIAHTCYINQIPVLVIRAISDMAGTNGSAHHSFNELKEMVANRASKIVNLILKHV